MYTVSSDARAAQLPQPQPGQVAVAPSQHMAQELARCSETLCGVWTVEWIRQTRCAVGDLDREAYLQGSSALRVHGEACAHVAGSVLLGRHPQACSTPSSSLERR